MKIRGKNYRKELNKSYQQFQFHREKELRELNKSDSKSFWKILNKFTGTRKESPDVDLSVFYKYFKKLNDDSEITDMLLPNVTEERIDPICELILNSEITVKEIEDAIDYLKNNKAPGYDMILNEYLKASKPLLLPTFCKLFNLIFDSGII